MTITRYNAVGLKYELSPTGAGDDQTSIALIGTDKKVIVNARLDELNQAWYNWQQKGMFIQTAFHMLSADAREFIMTGITPTEWNDIFSEEEN